MPLRDEIIAAHDAELQTGADSALRGDSSEAKPLMVKLARELFADNIVTPLETANPEEADEIIKTLPMRIAQVLTQESDVLAFFAERFNIHAENYGSYDTDVAKQNAAAKAFVFNVVATMVTKIITNRKDLNPTLIMSLQALSNNQSLANIFLWNMQGRNGEAPKVEPKDAMCQVMSMDMMAAMLGSTTQPQATAVSVEVDNTDKIKAILQKAVDELRNQKIGRPLTNKHEAFLKDIEAELAKDSSAEHIVKKVVSLLNDFQQQRDSKSAFSKDATVAIKIGDAINKIKSKKLIDGINKKTCISDLALTVSMDDLPADDDVTATEAFSATSDGSPRPAVPPRPERPAIGMFAAPSAADSERPPVPPRPKAGRFAVQQGAEADTNSDASAQENRSGLRNSGG